MRHSHDLIVIGAGAAGLTAAGGCAMLGLKVALIERAAMGGDCLNTGCVPSKALLAAADRAHAVRGAGAFGVSVPEPRVDFTAVRGHLHGAIATIAPHDSAERFETLGVEVVRGEAAFVDGRTVEVGGRRLTAPRIVIATGSRPAVPEIPGLRDGPYLTNESVFDLEHLPEHLLVLGGGPVAIELGQAFRRLGSRVTLIARSEFLSRDDPEASACVLEQLRADGVDLRASTAVQRVDHAGSGATLTLDTGERITGSHLLVATGRKPDFSALYLERAGVEAGPDGIPVDARRRTSNPRIFAIGDARAGPRFTHASGYEGTLCVLNIGLGSPSKADYSALPRVTYSDPELAQVGMTEAEARARHGGVAVWRAPFARNDRAITEGDTRGFIKIVKAGRKVVGATIVGARAGELLLPWIMAVAGKNDTFGLAGLILPYPTRSEASKAAAFAAHEALVFHPLAKRWARALARARGGPI